MPISPRVRGAVLLCLWTLIPTGYCVAQSDAQPDTQPPSSTSDSGIPTLTQAQVEEALAELDKNAALEEAAKEGIRTKLKQASKMLEEAAAFQTKAEQYRTAVESAPKEAETTREQFEALPSPEDAAPESVSGSAEELQQQLAALQAEHSTISEELSRVTAELAAIKNRPVEISARLPEVQRELEAIRQQLSDFGDPETVTSPARQAELFTLQAQHAKLLAEQEMLNQEQRSQAAREDLLTARQQFLQRRVANLTAKIESLRAVLDQKLMSEARQLEIRVRKALAAIPDDSEAGQRLGQEVQSLVEEFEGLVEDAKRVRAVHADLVSEKKTLLDEYASLQEQVKLGGGGAGMAQSLIDLQRRMRSTYLNIATPTLPNLDQTRLALLRVEEQLRELETVPPSASEETSEAVPELVALQREILEKLRSQYTLLVRALAEVRRDKGLFADELKNVIAEISEQLFWMRTSSPMSLETFTDIPGGLSWVVQPQHWHEVGQAFLRTFTRPRFLSLAFALGALVLLLARPLLVRSLRHCSESVKRISTDKYRYTLQAFCFTLLLALPVPLFCWFASFALAQSQQNQWTWDLAIGFQRIGWITFWAWLIAAVYHPAGLATNHFGWKAFPRGRIRAVMFLFIAGTAPLILLMAGTFHEDQNYYFDSVGRVALILLELWMAYLIWKLFYQSGGIMEALRRDQPVALMTRWRHFFSLFILVVLVSLIILAATGYVITSMSLVLGLMVTIAMVAVGQILFGVTLRWFTAKQRKFALAEALRRREEQQAAATEEADGELVAIDSEEEAARSLEDITDESKRLLGLLFALGILLSVILYWSETFPVWDFLDTVPVPPFSTLSVQELGQALVIAIFTVLFVRYLPGFVELGFLRATNFDPGTRLAITTLCQYGVTAVGLALFFAVLEIDWAQFGWIAAALSVGLGFGLQEVVANFVCGLILLFERPLRVGDVVTVENMTGTVAKIHLRATTIVNWDRQEFVVPNKTLITSTLLNWTLTASINRVVVPVGVAYGTDTDRAREILLEVAKEHPLVLEDPAPLATFEEFADSSLTLYLRCYLPDLDNRLGVITEIHSAIDQRFKQAEIEIAFPQQDLHLRSGWEKLREPKHAEST